MLSLPGNSNYRTMSSTKMDNSPNINKMKGHTKFNFGLTNEQSKNLEFTMDQARNTRNSSEIHNKAGMSTGMNKTYQFTPSHANNTFMSPAHKHLKDTFF